MKKADLQISGMHCASCALIIEKSLKKAQGVKEANINHSTEKATVAFDESQITLEQLIEIIKNRGYSAAVVGIKSGEELEKVHEKEIQGIKLEFIFSLVFAIPCFIIAMIFMPLGIEVPYANYVLFIFSTPIQFIIGYRFYKGAWIAMKNKSANMDTLIAVGTSAAYLQRLYFVFRPGNGAVF